MSTCAKCGSHATQLLYGPPSCDARCGERPPAAEPPGPGGLRLHAVTLTERRGGSRDRMFIHTANEAERRNGHAVMASDDEPAFEDVPGVPSNVRIREIACRGRLPEGTIQRSTTFATDVGWVTCDEQPDARALDVWIVTWSIAELP
jgi:hypothetical protein